MFLRLSLAHDVHAQLRGHVLRVATEKVLCLVLRFAFGRGRAAGRYVSDTNDIETVYSHVPYDSS